MPEYIDKAALYKEMLFIENYARELAKEKEVDEYTFLKRQWSLKYAVYYKQLVANFPTADAAPVVHAKWTENENFDIGFWICSNCSFVSEAIAAHKLYSYCPNCGAKMDLEG